MRKRPDQTWRERVDEECSLTVKVYKAADVPGYIAEILELDLITCGDDYPHAMEMAGDALRCALEAGKKLDAR